MSAYLKNVIFLTLYLFLTGKAYPLALASPDSKSAKSGAVWLPPANETLTYDAAGNRQGNAQWDYGWDAKNQLVRARTKNHNTAPHAFDITFTYDSEGRRVKKHVIEYANGAVTSEKIITFVWDGWDLLYERHQLPSGLTTLERKYLWGPDIADGEAGGAGGLLLITEIKGNSTTNLIPLYDGTGHVIALTDIEKNLHASYIYGPFGEKITATGPKANTNPWRWATKYLDEETGLYYFGMRYYDPLTGQWLSREPLGEEESLNLYSYCRNDPVNAVDRLGLDTIDFKAPLWIEPVEGQPGKYRLRLRVIAHSDESGQWEEQGWFEFPSFIGQNRYNQLIAGDEKAIKHYQRGALHTIIDQEVMLLEREQVELAEDSAKMLPGGYAAVYASREEFGKAALAVVGEAGITVFGGRVLTYGGKAGYLMARGATMSEARAVIYISNQLTRGAMTAGKGAQLTAQPLVSKVIRALPAPKPGSFNPHLPGGRMTGFEVGADGLFLPSARAHGANPSGSFLSVDPIPNEAFVRGPLATIEEWNAATHVSDAFVPPGVRLQLSIANPNPSLPGSGYGIQLQILNDADKARVIYSNTRPLPKK